LDVLNVLHEARTEGTSQFHMGIHCTGASIVSTSQGNFVLVAQIYPLHSLMKHDPLTAFGPKLLIALLATGLLCAILARHITAPIYALRVAAGRIADGDLSVRALPAIPSRNDELADLARDFDRMAGRIETFLQKQQELFGDISHELRSPLARLNLSLELLRHGETDAIDQMQIDLNRMDQLIGQILTLARLEMREGHKFVTTLNLRTIVEGVADGARFEEKAENKSVTITHTDDCWLMGDPALLRSCVENVVRNAVRYTRPGTKVEISLHLVNWSGAHSVRFWVSEHGCGVPQESLSRLFEPFYRVSQVRDFGFRRLRPRVGHRAESCAVAWRQHYSSEPV
jgi:two-component system sensor histidine kinase CpxA